MKVLSRKPAPQMIAKRDPITGLERLMIQDDDDDDSDASKDQPTPEQIRLRQQRELEEKQRRYDEARAKIFGDSGPSSGQSTPGNVTPPQSSEGRQGYRGRGRGGRGRGGGGASSNPHRNDNRQDKTQSPRPQNSQHPGSRELFDPGYAPKPGFNIQKRGGDSPQQPGRSYTQREDDQIVRSPRGPDESGRGGFGFARRGRQDG